MDTACSSSLAAVHMACESLRKKELDLALAGGVFVRTTPDFHIMCARAGMLSPDDKTRTFDAGANGFVPGEAAGVLVLKRLSDALKDKDHIYAVIRGSGMNQDGKTNGITAPNGRSQVRLLNGVYETFGIDPADISCVEAHGTATPLGDPIEVASLSQSLFPVYL